MKLFTHSRYTVVESWREFNPRIIMTEYLVGTVEWSGCREAPKRPTACMHLLIFFSGLLLFFSLYT